MQSRPLIVANWKMNGTLATVRPLADAVRAGLAGLRRVEDTPEDAPGVAPEVALCPPFVYLAEVAARLADSDIALGAQDLSPRAAGAHTGEVSAAMLMDYNCRFAIVGHSERRTMQGESNALAAEKAAAALDAGLRPIICIGESREERQNGATEETLDAQLAAVLRRCPPSSLRRAVIAYEPLWAIGSGQSATAGEIRQAHAFVRARLAAREAALAQEVPILYGGSVRQENAAAIFSLEEVAGALIGGASLQADEFIAICKAATKETS